MSNENQRPEETIRDSNLSASIWKNQGEKGPFYSVTFERVYSDDQGNAKNSKSFSGGELLRLARLAGKSYDFIGSLKAADKADAKAAA